MRRAEPVWLFDLDNTLHDASAAAFAGINEGMTAYIERELALDRAAADALRRHYWLRYGATLLGLVRHHGVNAAHFLHHVHLLPGLEQRVQGFRQDFAAIARLPGRKFIVTNAPAHYTGRVLGTLGVASLFDGVIAVEQMRMFGHWRPKPDTRMLRRLAVGLRVPPSRCVLVEDTLGHLKAARRVGMRTVWMQRFTRRARWGIAAGTRTTIVPAFVDRRVRKLGALAGAGF